MVFVACGLNHKTAPLDVREKVALPISKQNSLLNRLVSLPSVHEGAILSTCNRTEIYCDTEEPNSVVSWLAHEHQLSPEFIKPHFYLHDGYNGVRHTLRVASGLDSMMIGEPQILGQLKQAYQQACDAGTIKQNLRQIFQYVFGASKRIRNHSGIGNNPVSIAFAAVQLIHQLFSKNQSLRVFIIGSGETSSLVAKYLHQQGRHHFMVASRTHENAQRLATVFSGKTLTISDIPQHLSQADVIVSATACPLPFISKNLVKHALNARGHAPMFFLDLAVPRDIEADVAELDNVHLYNIDDLHNRIEHGMEERRANAQQAEQLIEIELENYIRKHRTLKANTLICDYRNQMQDMAQQELQRAIQKLSAGHCQLSVLTEFSERLVNKLTHTPTVGLKQAACDNRSELLDLAQYLFNLSTNANHEKIT
jgi:glutamyl-tRNA reductase